MSSRIKKHVPIYREDSSFMDKLIEEKYEIEDWGQALHFLIQNYKNQSKNLVIQKEITALSELMNSYYYIDRYNERLILNRLWFKTDEILDLLKYKKDVNDDLFKFNEDNDPWNTD